MSWIYRNADQHQCAIPEADLPAARPGDLWECDRCGKTWVVRDSQFYGKCFVTALPADLVKLSHADLMKLGGDGGLTT